jgi:hypothetical protein
MSTNEKRVSNEATPTLNAKLCYEKKIGKSLSWLSFFSKMPGSNPTYGRELKIYNETNSIARL